MFKARKTVWFGIALAACISSVNLAQAATYPAKPVTLIVPFAPGGATDSVGRIVAEFLGKRLGSTVVVENRGGAGGTIGSGMAARAAADGYTLLLGTAETFGIAENMFKDLPFDAQRDFTPVALATRIPSVFAVNPSVAAKDMKEFIALGKQNADKINFGSPGIGTNIHLISEMLKARYKLDMTHVPYKGGAPAMADLLAGQIQIMPAAVVVAAPHVKAGKLRALAITSQNRSPLLPDVPTMAEAGVADFVVGGWFGLLAPAGTPQPVLDRLEKEMAEIGTNPEFQQKMANVGGEGNVLTGKDFGQFISTETERWKGIVQAAHIGPAK